MAVLYTYKVYQDLYSLKNINVNPFTYTLSKKECDSLTQVETKVILAGETIYLPLTFIDGKYQIDITDGVNTVHKYDIYYYNNLLLHIIDSIESSVCPCVCKDCDECNDENDYKVKFNTLISTISLASLNKNKYTDYLVQVATILECDFDEELLAFMSEKLIDGTDNLQGLYLRLIGLHYLTYYYVDLMGAIDTEEAVFIRDKYKSAKILKCIKKLGLDIEEVSDSLMDNMDVYYWQLTNTVDDIDDVKIALAAINYLDAKSHAVFNTFEQGTNVSYTTIGRIVFAVKETNMRNFVVNDSLGNDVTNDYDTYYFEDTKTALYVSKAVISISNLYFKFKKITNI